MKTVRRKHNRRGTKRRQQRYHRTKKLYQYGGKSIISYQSGGVPPDNPEDIYDAGEEPADVEPGLRRVHRRQRALHRQGGKRDAAAHKD